MCICYWASSISVFLFVMRPTWSAAAPAMTAHRWPPMLRLLPACALFRTRARARVARPHTPAWPCAAAHAGVAESDGNRASVSSRDHQVERQHSERYQRPLSQVERKKLRADSQRLGRDLCGTTLGKAGITPNFIISLGDALAKNELVKVRRGPP